MSKKKRRRTRSSPNEQDSNSKNSEKRHCQSSMDEFVSVRKQLDIDVELESDAGSEYSENIEEQQSEEQQTDGQQNESEFTLMSNRKQRRTVRQNLAKKPKCYDK